VRSILSIQDLRDDEINETVSTALRLQADGWASATTRIPFVTALVFLTPSLRTRTGFAAATLRLGGSTIDVAERRETRRMSAPESLSDTIRAMAGIADVVVVRTDEELVPSVVDDLSCVLVNGGDRDHHPTQALIDLAALESRGPVKSLRIGISGDLSGRVTTSLLQLLERRPPRSLVLSGPQGPEPVALGPVLAARTTHVGGLAPDGLDVVYLAGLPKVVGTRELLREEREAFSLGLHNVGQLGRDAVVLCPMPVIDELDPALRADPRVAMFEQSDHGVYVRAALLQLLRRT
jgi:aspartate carbamoyltransferase catalytic subunit